ncbi:hypothetical protein MJH12_19410, partial [bacterium]|nr:hypothetical protein [bacterium]
SVSILLLNSCDGIKESDLKTICTRFRQLDNSLTRTQDGLGIGLTLVQGFMNLLDATFRIESNIEERWLKIHLEFLKKPTTLPKEFLLKNFS